MIEDDCANKGIAIPNVNIKILSKVTNYCNKHVLAKPVDDITGATGVVASNTTAPVAIAEDLKNWDAEFSSWTSYRYAILSLDHLLFLDLLFLMFPFRDSNLDGLALLATIYIRLEGLLVQPSMQYIHFLKKACHLFRTCEHFL